MSKRPIMAKMKILVSEMTSTMTKKMMKNGLMIHLKKMALTRLKKRMKMRQKRLKGMLRVNRKAMLKKKRQTQNTAVNTMIMAAKSGEKKELILNGITRKIKKTMLREKRITLIQKIS